MVKSAFYREMLLEINTKEQQVADSQESVIGQADTMIHVLHDVLCRFKGSLQTTPFSDDREEIEFFRIVKPQVLGKLIFYNNIYRIETSCPVRSGKLYRKYFCSELKLLKRNNEIAHGNTEFYRYYRSGRTDRDREFFQRGQLQFFTGLDSFYFETDAQFSTYYDQIAARITAYDLLYNFLLSRIDPDNPLYRGNLDIPEELCWTGSKNALIELIYALYIAGVISNGKIGIRRVSLIFQSVFKTPLGDIHHAFHRMKDRAGQRTLFIDQLKNSLEQYMDKGL